MLAVLVSLALIAAPVDHVVCTFSYEQAVRSDVNAYISDDTIYVDAAQVASLLLGQCSASTSTLTLELGGDALPIEISMNECRTIDTTIGIPLSAFEKIPGCRAVFSEQELMIRLYSEVSLAVDKIDDQWRRHLQRSYEGTVQSHHHTSVAKEFPLLGGTTVVYDAHAATSMSSTTVSATVQQSTAAFGGVLDAMYAVVLAPLQQPRIDLQALWSVTDPGGRLWKSISLGEVLWNVGGDRKIYGMEISNTPIGGNITYGTDTTALHLSAGDVVDLFIDGMFVGSVSADSTGRAALPTPLMYGTTSVVAEIYRRNGTVDDRTMRFFVAPDAAPEHRFLYHAGIGIEEWSQRLYSTLDVWYGVTDALTVHGDITANGSWLLPWDYLVATGMTYRLNPFTSATANHVHQRETQFSIRSLPTPQLDVSLDGSIFTRQKPSDPIATARTNIGIFRPMDLPLSLRFTSTTWMLPLQRLSTSLQWDLRYQGQWANIALRSQHLWASTFTTTATHLDVTVRSPFEQTHLLLRGLRLNATIGTLWSSRQTFWDVTLEQQYTQHIFQTMVSVSFSSTRPTQISASVTARLQEVLASVKGITSTSATSTSTHIRGGLTIDDEHWDLSVDRTLRISTSSVVLTCFEDIDADGIWDHNERAVDGIDVAHGDGRAIPHASGGTRIADLLPDTEYTFRIDAQSIENPHLYLTSDEISVVTSAQHTTVVYVPLQAANLLEGRLVSIPPRSGLQVRLEDRDGRTWNTRTFSDGTFLLPGIPPGSYQLQVGSDRVKSVVLESAGRTVSIDV